MSIIRERIKLTGQDISGITFTLGSNDSFLGYQQEIDNLTQATMLDLVNPVVDVETRKFKMFGHTIFSFMFNNVPLFTAAGFKPSEISGNSLNMLNSFFTLDFYDTYNPNTQVKIFTTYLTKIGIVPVYSLYPNADNQLYYWYVPQSFVDIQTGTTTIGYVKLSFYNAKSGRTTIFYNQVNAALLTPEKMYFKAELNVVNKTWKFLNLVSDKVDARSMTTSAAYSQRIENTYGKYDNTKQLYPSGSTYNYKTNKYITPSGTTVI